MNAEQKLEKLYQTQVVLSEFGWVNRWGAGNLIVEAVSVDELLGAVILLKREGWKINHFYEGDKPGAMTGMFNLVGGQGQDEIKK